MLRLMAIEQTSSAQAISAEPRPAIVFANTNLAEASYAHLSSPEEVGYFADYAGYDAVEWHPWYTPAWRVGRAIARRDLILNSLHQSPRTVWEARQAADNAHGGLMTSILLPIPAIGRLITPSLRRSARYMRNVVEIADQRIAAEEGEDWGHKPMPGVFYPHPNADIDAEIRTMANTSFDLAQPSDRLARLLMAFPSAKEMTEELLERGYGRWRAGQPGKAFTNGMPYIFNTHEVRRHFGREGPGRVSNLNRSLWHLVCHANALQLSLGVERLAHKEPHIPTHQELKQVLIGGGAGDLLAEMLWAFKLRQKYGYPPLAYVVVDVPASSVERATGHRYTDDIREDYATIAAAMKAFFRS